MKSSENWKDFVDLCQKNMASEAERSEKNSASVAGSTISRVEEPYSAVGGGVISKVYGLGD